MKKTIRANIISLTFLLVFIFTMAPAEVVIAGCCSPPADKSQININEMPIIARHKHNNKDSPIIHLNKHELKLTKGKSATLKAALMPGGAPVQVTWYSSNPNIAKVSGTGKVTAVGPGIAVISAYSEKYLGLGDQTGYSGECYVNVQGGAKDARPLGTGDQAYSYGRTRLKAPTGKYKEELANVKKRVGGNAYSENDYITSLIYGSSVAGKAHTEIYIVGSENSFYGFGFIARAKSPIRTSRGIGVGAKKSAILQKYGLPTHASYYTEDEDGNIFEAYQYVAKAAGKDMYIRMTFFFPESKYIVSEISFFLGAYYR